MTTGTPNKAVSARQGQHFRDNSEIIKALTPMYVATIGGLIALSVVLVAAFTNKVDGAMWASAMGLAGTAIGGAAGLAQAGNAKITSQDSEGKKVEAESGS